MAHECPRCFGPSEVIKTRRLEAGHVKRRNECASGCKFPPGSGHLTGKSFRFNTLEVLETLIVGDEREDEVLDQELPPNSRGGP